MAMVGGMFFFFDVFSLQFLSMHTALFNRIRLLNRWAGDEKVCVCVCTYVYESRLGVCVRMCMRVD